MRMRIASGLFTITWLVGGAQVHAAPGASCASPKVTVSASEVGPGDTLTVQGAGFFDSCNDVSVNGVMPPAPGPLEAIEITFAQAENDVVLAVVDAKPDFSFSTQVEVPTSAEPGEALITAGVSTLGIPVVITPDASGGSPVVPLTGAAGAVVAGAALVHRHRRSSLLA